MSWGTLLQDSQNRQTVLLYPWLMLPALFVVAALLMFNFLGDGLRAAASAVELRGSSAEEALHRALRRRSRPVAVAQAVVGDRQQVVDLQQMEDVQRRPVSGSR